MAIMTQLVFVSERAAYLPGTNNLGIIIAEGRTAIAVDTGIDKEAARLLRRACETAGLRLCAVISTHHHADHVGGNDYLVRNIPELEVYAPQREAPFIEDPYLEPMYLSSGARPLDALHNKFVMATPSPVHHRITPGVRTIAGVELQLIAIPGHSLAQVAVVVDDVCYAADGFFGQRVLNKYGVPYAHDVGAQIASFDVLTMLTVSQWIPGHGDAVDRAGLVSTLHENRNAVQHSRELVLAAIATPQTLPATVAAVQNALAMPSASVAQYAVFASGIAAYLNWLVAEGAAVAELSDAGIVWRAV
jgi:glyoxylase-like metal-dependent hydrolase (beta-lactamase superfamily II)